MRNLLTLNIFVHPPSFTSHASVRIRNLLFVIRFCSRFFPMCLNVCVYMCMCLCVCVCVCVCVYVCMCVTCPWLLDSCIEKVFIQRLILYEFSRGHPDLYFKNILTSKQLDIIHRRHQGKISMHRASENLSLFS